MGARSWRFWSNQTSKRRLESLSRFDSNCTFQMLLQPKLLFFFSITSLYESHRFRKSPVDRLFATRIMQNSSNVCNTGSTTPRLTAPQRLKSFYCFSRLPKELRIAIWEEALKFPRTVTITEYGPVKRIGDTDPYSIKMKSLRAVWQPPALLQVNRESREEGLRKYVGLFSFFESGNPVWFNFESDWLCFDTLEAMRKLFEMEVPRSLPGIRANRPSFPFFSQLLHSNRKGTQARDDEPSEADVPRRK